METANFCVLQSGTCCLWLANSLRQDDRRWCSSASVFEAFLLNMLSPVAATAAVATQMFPSCDACDVQPILIPRASNTAGLVLPFCICCQPQRQPLEAKDRPGWNGGGNIVERVRNSKGRDAVGVDGERISLMILTHETQVQFLSTEPSFCFVA